DLARRGFGPFGNGNLQHPVLALGADALRISAVGQRETAMEHATRALDARVVFILDLAFALALAPDRQHALVHVDFDVLGVDARDISLDHEALVFLTNVHAGRPFAGDHVGLIATLFGIEKAVQHLAKLAIHGVTAPLPITVQMVHVLAPFAASRP